MTSCWDAAMMQLWLKPLWVTMGGPCGAVQALFWQAWAQSSQSVAGVGSYKQLLGQAEMMPSSGQPDWFGASCVWICPLLLGTHRSRLIKIMIIELVWFEKNPDVIESSWFADLMPLESRHCHSNWWSKTKSLFGSVLPKKNGWELIHLTPPNSECRIGSSVP